jgi:tRNA threonylcarbamoyladenosine biosynthesis protein TsaB
MGATLLAFDTSTDALAVALAAPHGRATRNLAGGAAASASLVAAILGVLGQHGIGPGDVDAIAFGRGPGTFTGLRVACAVAQGLAFGAGKPVLPIDGLLVVAEDARRRLGAESDFEIGVAMDARMGELYAARYRHGADGWRCTAAPALVAPAALRARWGERWPQHVAGSGLAMLSPGADAAWESTADRAAALLVLAEQAWARGEAVDAAHALPLYLRDKIALTTREREARAAGVGPAGASVAQA